MAVAMDAAVASIGNDHDVKLKYTVELRALNIQHMKNTPLDPQITKPPNHQIPGVCVQVFRFSSQVWWTDTTVYALYAGGYVIVCTQQIQVPVELKAALEFTVTCDYMRLVDLLEKHSGFAASRLSHCLE